MVSEHFLDEMRSSGDPLADSVIQSFLASGEITELNALMGTLHANLARPPAFPAPLAAYLEASSALPAWADPALIQRAQRFFTLHGPVFGLVMLFKSLPILYAGGKGGAQVLVMTGQLTQHYRRRAGETLRFILDVMEPGGLAPGGKGIRQYAFTDPAWRGHEPEWGRPINQEELAGTLLAFSTVTLEGVGAMGLRVGKEDAEAYLHAWKVIGHVLGIDPRMYPKDVPAAKPFWKAMVRRNFVRTEAGLLLIRDHQEFLTSLIPGKFFDRGVPTLLRYLMGRKISNTVLDLPRSSAPFALLLFLVEIFHLEKIGYLVFPFLMREARKLSIGLMESLQGFLMSGNTSRPFHIPPSLTAQ
jgi:hypothetical protein